MKWSEKTWQESAEIFDKILNQSFNQDLMQGTLTEDRFYFYIQQDIYYLKEYGKTLAVIGSRLQNDEHIQAFYQFANSAMQVENALHESYVKQFSNFSPPPISPTCLLYKSYLSAQLVTQSIEICLAAVLPCFWIYKKVGDYVLANGKIEGNPYKNWILTYGGEEFAVAVEKAIEICDFYAENSTDEVRKKMTEAYLYGAKMEWMFWDSAYKKETWAI
ncbi:MAG: thiaminase [Bacteroidota bacterium]|jgi:thiaminase/transcriptional activator TenA